MAQLGARFHGMEEVNGSNPFRSTNPIFLTPRELRLRVAVTPSTNTLHKVQRRSKRGPKFVFNGLTRGMDQTVYHPRPISLITEPVGMHGVDGKRFEVRIPLGRHFPLSRDRATILTKAPR